MQVTETVYTGLSKWEAAFSPNRIPTGRGSGTVAVIPGCHRSSGTFSFQFCHP